MRPWAAPGSDVDAPLELSESARYFAANALSERTRQAYTSDFAAFATWCDQRAQSYLPARPETVVEYVVAHADLLDASGLPLYAPATLTRWVTSINAAHRHAGHAPPGAHPQVAVVLTGVRRVLGQERSRRQKAPLLREDLAMILRALPRTYPSVVTGARDACLLVVGFAGAYRRDELVGLRTDDVTWHSDDGLHVRLRHSKVDQEARGAVKALPFGQDPLTCPPCAVARWFRVLVAQDRSEVMAALIVAPGTRHVCRTGLVQLSPRPLLPVLTRSGRLLSAPLSGHGANLVVKRRALAAGLDPTSLGAHSLRAGFVTQALRNGATTAEVMRQTLHSSPATVAIYDREHNPLAGNAVTRVGL